MNILGIDYGTKYIGLALADDTLKIAIPHKMIENNDSLVNEIKNIIQNQKIGTIVVGRPLGLSGKDTQQTKAVDEFINKIKKEVEVPVISFDERLTTKLAHKLLQGPAASRDQTSSHSIAASIILQNYLDQI